MTELDQAYQAMTGGDEAAGLRFYRTLADATLFLLLEREAEGDQVAPRVFDLADGPVILAYDSEERLAAMGDAPLPYAALPGRVVAQLLAGQSQTGQAVSLGLNFGSGAASETLLPPKALVWLADMLETAPDAVEATPQQFFAPQGLPEALTLGLEAAMQAAAGLASAALLAGVRYAGGRRGHMLAVINAHPAAEAALARSVAEALAFSGLDAGELDVTFLEGDAAAVASLARVAVVFEVPERVVVETLERPAPGMDPGKPPLLR